MKVITYRIMLLEPALVTSLRGDPNSGVAFDYIPGSVLRGIFIGKYLGSKQTDAGDPTLRRLFFDGTTRYLNGYPLDVHGRPSMPVPASWQTIKDQEDEIFDFAVAVPVEVPDEERQWKSVSAPFYTLPDENVRLVQPTRNVAVHTQRTARFGRAMPEYRPDVTDRANREANKLLGPDEIRGAVYRYDALAAGQTFEAVIICDNDSDEQTLKDLIEGRVTIGGSRSGGYGRAEMSLAPSAGKGWDTTGDDLPEDKLIVTLQSDVLLRDARGQFAVDPELLRQVLSRHLRVELELEDAFLGTELVGGFNRKWGLPLPQSLAVRMGSVLIFKDPGCDNTQLDTLEARGIGERRVEGFGCIAFNRLRAATLSVKPDTRQNHSLPVSTLNDPEASKLAQLMLIRMLRKRLDEGLLAAANGVKIVHPPSSAQISRLREIVLKELRAPTPDTGKICQFIKSIEARGTTRRQFERCTVDGKLLLSWLTEDLLRCNSQDAWTMDDNAWKDRLQVNRSEVGVRIGGLKAEIDDNVRLEYVLRLIDLVLANAARQSGKES